MNLVIGIDPGPSHSGVACLQDGLVVKCWKDMANNALRSWLRASDFTAPPARIVCEWIQAMGMPCGQDVFLTCKFVGRLEEICAWRGTNIEYITRPTIKTRLCGSARAKDANVRQALIDRLGAPGTRKHPGPTFGVTSHSWSALAVAVAIDLK